MDKTAWTWFIVGVLVVIGVVAYLSYEPQPAALGAPPLAQSATTAEALPAPPTAEAQPAQPPTDAPAHRVPEAMMDSPEPLPGLGGSDPAMQSSIEQLYGSEPLESFLIPKDIIRRLVVMVDSLPKDKLPLELRAFKRIEGSFVVQGDGEQLFVADANAQRYAAFIDLVQRTDAAQLVKVYFRYYPLFQKAYEELGYRNRYFNDRVIQVIDHLLDTPELAGPVELVRPKVMYEYADPELQARSAGQKALLRMGPGNAVAVKNKLREIRNELADKTGVQ